MAVNAKKIVPLGKQAGYLGARKLAGKKGMRLPPNVLHDDYLDRTERWKQVREIYPAWAQEIIVHPEENGRFKKGSDIVDSETGWTVPASYVPEEAVGRIGVGLLLVPGDIEEKGKVVVHPAGEPIILTPFIQENGGCGRVDEATRVPLAISGELLDQLYDAEKRWLFRIAGVGVRPIARGGCSGRRGVAGVCRPDSSFGVAGEAASLQVETAGKGIVISGVTSGEFRALLDNANASLEDFALMVPPEKLEAIVRLMSVLGAKA